MNATATKPTSQDIAFGQKLSNIARYGRQVVGNDFMDWFESKDFSSIELRTCLNRNQLGVKDVYVAWMCADQAPTDLEHKNGYSIGSV